jgi:PKD repeat protein
MRINFIYRVLFSLLATIQSFSAMAQVPVIQWQRSLGGSSDDYANSVHQTADGGYIVAGYTSSNNGDVSGNHGGKDMWVVKLDNAGNTQWQKTLGGSGDDVAKYVQQTTDAGYIIAGNTYSNDGDVSGNHGNADAWVVKLDNVGNIQWQKTYGGNNNDAANSVQQLSDGGYILGCTAISENNGDIIGSHGAAECWVVKISSTGVIEWSRCMGGQSYDYAHQMQQTADGGFVMGGVTLSLDGDVTGYQGGGDHWVVKLDNIQEIEWQKTLGGTGTDVLTSVIQTTDGGYITAGHVYSQDGDIPGSGFHGTVFNDYWVVKLNSTGAIQWKKALGGTGNDLAQSIQQTVDGGYVVFGYTTSNDDDVSGNNGYVDYWIVKLNSSGTIEWQKTLGGTGQEGYNNIQLEADGAHSIQQTTDSGYIMAGYSKSNDGDVSGNHGNFDYWVVKLGDCISPQPAFGYTNSGNTFNFNYTGSNGYTSISWDLGDNTPISTTVNPTHTYAASGSYTVCVTVTNSCGSDTACQTINTESTGVNNIQGFVNIRIYPNPIAQQIMIDNAEAGAVLDIYNSTGSLVSHTKLEGDKDNVDVTSLSSGVYLMRFTNKDGGQGSRKFVKE